jgi:glycosyltransferase involved in cell wall biosynthesis
VARRVLYICHNHPAVRPGGAEGYALDLHRAMGSTPGWESVFLAHGGPPLSTVRRQHETMLHLVDRSSDAYFFHSDGSGFDQFFGWNERKELWTHYLRDFLDAYRPDVVHFQHTQFLGYDMIREVRNSLPNAAIVYTLHEFLPICHQNGQMVRTFNDHELCTHATPRRCHECFPEHSPQAFFLRKRFIQAMFSLVDMFIAPSEFLRERYVDWGIPAGRIRVLENGCAHQHPPVDGPADGRLPSRIGFFGQLNQFKGILVLLKAMRALQKQDVDAHLYVHGANLDLQTSDFQKKVADLLAACKDSVTLVGKYDQDRLPSLMEKIDWVVVPSIWWENSPLVIQEAFLHRRPVICADIGGMAEKVVDGVSGLHFRARDAASLARTLRRAVTKPELWQALQAGIPHVPPMSEHVERLSGTYQELLSLHRDTAEGAVLRL